MTTHSHRPGSGPELDPGITLLRRPSARSASLHDLVVRQLDHTAGRTLWVDARNNASTYALHGRVPDDRLLDHVEIARAFTAYQHHTLVNRLVREAGPATDLIVVPCTASLYQDDDVEGPVGQSLLDASLSILGEIAATFDVPVLVTTTGRETDAERLVADHADRELTATETAQGFRFQGDGYETRVYWHEDYFQTTLRYWTDLFGCTCDESGAATGPDLPVPEIEG